MKGIEIRADAQMVNSQVTSGTQTTNAEAIASIPNVKSVEDVLKLQAGVVKQGNKALLDRLNGALATVKADGTYATLYRKWFSAEPPVLPAR